MRIPSDSSSLRKALGAGAALISLAACSGGGSQFSPGAGQGASAQSHSFARVAKGPLSLADIYPSRATGNRSKLLFVDPAAIKAQIDVSQYGATSNPGEVNEYVAANKKNKKPFCQLGDLTGVNAIETDAAGNLWVPYETPSNVTQVVEYAPDCGKIGTTLADPNGQPVDIAFAASGIDYVSDILGATSGAGQISIYPKGATSPSGELTNPAVFFSLGVAVDTKGNVYQSYLGNSQGTAGGVLEFKAGKGKGAVLKGIKIDEPGVVFLDSKENMIVPDQGGTALDTYAPPYTKLTSTFPLQAQSIQCALDKAETTLACADGPNNAIDIYTYPAGKYQYSFDAGLSSSLSTIGVAQDPTY
jgi:hypothetical protein